MNLIGIHVFMRFRKLVIPGYENMNAFIYFINTNKKRLY